MPMTDEEKIAVAEQDAEAIASQIEARDEFGRDQAERTIELEIDDCELIAQEVEAGKWKSFSEALHYVLGRGVAEIKRSREQQERNTAKTLLADNSKKWTDIMSSDPSMVNNASLVAKMLAELSELSAKAQPKEKTRTRRR